MASRTGCKPDNEMREKVRELYAKGLTFSEIARQVDRSPWAVSSMLRRMGVHACIRKSDEPK